MVNIYLKPMIAPTFSHTHKRRMVVKDVLADGLFRQQHADCVFALVKRIIFNRRLRVTELEGLVVNDEVSIGPVYNRLRLRGLIPASVTLSRIILRNLVLATRGCRAN